MKKIREEKQYWLAEAFEIDSYGTVWKVKLCDGPHSNPEGVTKALAIYNGISFIKPKPHEQFVMVTVEPVQNIEVDINQESVNILNMAHQSLMNRITER